MQKILICLRRKSEVIDLVTQFKKTIQMLHGNKAMIMINDVEWCAMMLLTYDIQFINDTIEFFQDLYLMWKAILI